MMDGKNIRKTEPASRLCRPIVATSENADSTRANPYRSHTDGRASVGRAPIPAGSVTGQPSMTCPSGGSPDPTTRREYEWRLEVPATHTEAFGRVRTTAHYTCRSDGPTSGNPRSSRGISRAGGA